MKTALLILCSCSLLLAQTGGVNAVNGIVVLSDTGFVATGNTANVRLQIKPTTGQYFNFGTIGSDNAIESMNAAGNAVGLDFIANNFYVKLANGNRLQIAGTTNGCIGLGAYSSQPTCANGAVHIEQTFDNTLLEIFKGPSDTSASNTLTSDASARFGGTVQTGFGSTVTGAVLLTGKTSTNTVTVTVGDSTATGTVTIPGLTGTAVVDVSNSTAAVAGLIGATCPAVTCTAAYTWMKTKALDGSDVYFPVWK